MIYLLLLLPSAVVLLLALVIAVCGKSQMADALIAAELPPDPDGGEP